MGTPRSLRTSGQPFRLPARVLSGIVGLLMFVLLARAARGERAAAFDHVLLGSAQQASPSGEEVYVDRLGCWNCHGQSGGGGGGAGPAIAKTRLPLRRFISYVRLPAGQMPPLAPILASDAELAIVYRWLDGAEAVKTPPPVTISLKEVEPRAKAGEPELLWTAQALESTPKSEAPLATSLRYRVTVRTEGNIPAANRACEYQLAGRTDWSTFTTDEQGEALLGPDRGFVVVADAPATGKKLVAARLHPQLAVGKYVFVVEAIDYAQPERPIVVGVGTATVKVE